MNKYSVPFRTSLSFVHNASRQHNRPVRYACGPSGRVTACVVYTADSIRDSIRTKKNDSQVPNFVITKYRKIIIFFENVALSKLSFIDI